MFLKSIGNKPENQFANQEVVIAFILDNCCFIDPVVSQNKFLDIQIKALRQFFNSKIDQRYTFVY